MSKSVNFTSSSSTPTIQHGVSTAPQHLIQLHLHLQPHGPSPTLQLSTEQPMIQNSGGDAESKSIEAQARRETVQASVASRASSVSRPKDIRPAETTCVKPALAASAGEKEPQQTTSKKQKRRERRSNWKDTETFLLLESWRKHFTKLADGSSYNEKRRIWGEIYDTFIRMCAKSGIEKSEWEYDQVRKRITNLQYEFKVLQPKVQDTDPERAAILRRGFPYYEAIERIMDTSPNRSNAPLPEAALIMNRGPVSIRQDSQCDSHKEKQILVVDLDSPTSPISPSSTSPVTPVEISEPGGPAHRSIRSPSQEPNSLNNPFGVPYTVIAAPPPTEEDVTPVVTQKEASIIIKKEKESIKEVPPSPPVTPRGASLREYDTVPNEDEPSTSRPAKRRRQSSEGPDELLDVFRDIRDLWRETLDRQQEQHNELIRAQREQTAILLSGLKDIFQDMFKQ